ncbi:hypothetical protein CVT26_012591 [Gymnopilus dilepis]|uniref:DUF6533 domain-containing protein n=1 Tax=Gymnopilus dilepis TaxID=231916 RepID=A0A409YPR6_9AGAR|nr:hypothetical protein CVT26_012591 [Gymnopilus dilepis]
MFHDDCLSSKEPALSLRYLLERCLQPKRALQLGRRERETSKNSEYGQKITQWNVLRRISFGQDSLFLAKGGGRTLRSSIQTATLQNPGSRLNFHRRSEGFSLSQVNAALAFGCHLVIGVDAEDHWSIAAAAAAQAWDLIVSLGDEIEYLWRGKFRSVKALYIGSRYGLLVGQLCVFLTIDPSPNCICSLHLSLNQFLNFQSSIRPLDASFCAGILVFKAVAAQGGLTLVEIILLIRVYALCNQSFRAKCFLAIIFIVSTVLEVTGMSLIIRSLSKESGCQTPRVDKQAVVLSGTGAGLCQFVVFVTTIANLLSSGKRRTPLTSLMLKEGVASFILLLGAIQRFLTHHIWLIMVLSKVLLAVMITCEVIRSFYLKKGNINYKEFSNAAFSWVYPSYASGCKVHNFSFFIGSRLILNMRKVAVKQLSMFRGEQGQGPDPTPDENSVYLTSLIE